MFILKQLWLEVISFLSLKDVCSLFRVSKYFSLINIDEYLWESLCNRDHKYLPPKMVMWKELYKIQHERKIFLSKRAQRFTVVINPNSREYEKIEKLTKEGGKCFIFEQKSFRHKNGLFTSGVISFLLKNFNMKLMKKGDFIDYIPFQDPTYGYIIFNGETLISCRDIDWNEMIKEFPINYWKDISFPIYFSLHCSADLIKNSRLYFSEDFPPVGSIDKLCSAELENKEELEKCLVNRTKFPFIRGYFVKENFTYFVYVFFMDKKKGFDLLNADYKGIFEEEVFFPEGYSLELSLEKDRSYYRIVMGFL